MQAKVDADDGSVKLSWDAPSDALSFKIAYNAQPSGIKTERSILEKNYLLVQQPRGFTYAWQVRSVCQQGQSEPSKETFELNEAPQDSAWISDPNLTYTPPQDPKPDPEVIQATDNEGITKTIETPDEFEGLFDDPITVLVPSKTDSTKTVEFTVLPSNRNGEPPTTEQIQTALKTLKPTCAGIVSEYSCGNHDTAPAYSGEIISVNAGDEVAMNTMIISIVDIDGSGNGNGLIKVPMMNNIKIGVALSGIKVAKGGCIVAGKAETSGIDVAVLNDKQRQNLAKAYEIYKKTLDIAEELAPEIAKGINSVKDNFEALKAKKEATRKLLAQSNLEDLSEVLNNCGEIVSQSRAAQDSLEKTICLIKTGKAKGNIAKLEKASKANIDFINKLGPTLAQCQSKPQWQNWEQTPCKGGPCVDFDYSEFECKKELKGVFGVEEKSPKNYHVSIDIATEKWLDGEGKTFYKTYIDCAVKEIKEWTYFDVKLNKIEKAGRIYPFQSQSTLPNQNSFEASKMELPMAGEWGNNLFSIGSAKIDDYIFLGRVLHFCPNVEPAIKGLWTRWFKGAKTTAESVDFAESIKTISDYTFAIVDGYYICKSIGAAAWRGLSKNPDLINGIVNANKYIKEGKFIENVSKIDLMGGRFSQLDNNFVNIDIQATKGINGSVSDLSKFIKPNSIDEIVCTSPQADFLSESSKVMKSGSKIYINGSAKNPFFNKIKKGKVENLGFEVISEMQPLNSKFSDIKFYFTDGVTEIKSTSMFTTILIKK